MSDAWTQERVRQLAPDAASLKAAQGLAQVRKWVTTGRDDRAAWGELQGSGAKPYQAIFDLLDGASKCSCPSRKFPCKHALGLMLIFSSDAQAMAAASAPAWVEEWLAARSARAQKKQERAEAPPKPVDEAAAAQRREKRLARIGDGLTALKTWCEDLVRGGIALVPSKGYAFFDEPARRMIDAQAPGVGRRIQKLAEIAASGGGWQRPFLEQLASIHLLIRAFENLENLSEATRQDVSATLGVPAKLDDGASPPVRDTWQIISREVESQDNLRVQRTWLFGRQTRRAALVLNFAAGPAPLDLTLVPSMSFEGEVQFYPGNGARAEVTSRGPLAQCNHWDGLETLDELCDWAGERFARHPWQEELAAPLLGVVPVRQGTGWAVIDRRRQTLPVSVSTDGGWLALALSGGHPVDLAAAYDGRQLRPLAVVAGGEYVPLRSPATEAE